MGQSSIVDTEVHLHKIDSVFHLFSNFMGDIKKGNIDMLIIRSNITIGSRFKNNLFRITGRYNMNDLDGKRVLKTTTYQFRYNRILKHNSIFLFYQKGSDFRSFMDDRELIGGGYRVNLIKKKKGYFDYALGAMYESEKYPAYKFLGENYDDRSAQRTRFTLNVFSKIDLTKNIKSFTTIYSQWNAKDFFGDYRLFFNQNIRFIVNKNISTFIRYFINEPSVKYVKKVKYNSDLVFGLTLNL
tara:strand:- start:1217 stop:1942 length:726 start_codon:yes stop_codon:yes gene_type:complete